MNEELPPLATTDEYDPEPDGEEIEFLIPGAGGLKMGGIVIERQSRPNGFGGDPLEIVRVRGDDDDIYEIGPESILPEQGGTIRGAKGLSKSARHGGARHGERNGRPQK